MKISEQKKIIQKLQAPVFNHNKYFVFIAPKNLICFNKYKDFIVVEYNDSLCSENFTNLGYFHDTILRPEISDCFDGITDLYVGFIGLNQLIIYCKLYDFLKENEKFLSFLDVGDLEIIENK